MNAKPMLSAIVAGSALILSPAAGLAQAQPQPPAAEPQVMAPPAAEACLEDLRAFNQTMVEDGYWAAGWGPDWGYGVTPGPAGAPPPAAGPAAPGPEAADAAWAARWGMTSPSYQIRTLHAAAVVLAQRGDEQGCAAVLAELQEIYGGYVEELRTAGVDPGQVTTWRQEQLVAAQPVTEIDASFLNVDDVTGTELRNAEDEWLGTIEDVVFDPQSGGIQYVIVSRGGLFGLGEEQVAVPWTALKATPSLDTFVLNATEDVMEQAPRVDAAEFTGPGEHRENVDIYWQEYVPG